MNRTLKTITAILGAGAMLLSSGSCMKLTKMQDATAESDVPPKLVFLGDSIAAGYGLDGYSPDDLYNCSSYANILGERYRNALDGKYDQVTVNDAVTGDTSSQLLAHIKEGEFDGALGGSDAVVISIGGNDLLNVIWDITRDLGYDQENRKFSASDFDLISAIFSIASFNETVDEALSLFTRNLNEITDEIRTRTDAEIFVQTLYDPFSDLDVKFITDITGSRVAEFNSIVEENAEKDGTHRYTVVDVAKDLEGKSGELTNISKYDVHPNQEGHKVIAEAVDAAIHSHTYTYTYQEEVTDTGAVITLIWICVAAAILIIAAAVLIVVKVKRKKENDT